MSDAILTLTPATLPEGFCPATEQERLNAFVAAIRAALPGSYSTVNTGPNTPAANDRDKHWLRDNADGSFDGTYSFYDGTWKRKHPLDPGFIGIWPSSAALVPGLDGGTAGVATTISGPFWEIYTALEAKFPLGAGTLPSGTAVAVGDTGGEEKHVLLTAELPSVLGSMKATYETLLTRKTSGNSAGFSSGNNYTQDVFNDIVKGGDDTAHQNMPPYFGVHFIRRSVRLWYSIG